MPRAVESAPGGQQVRKEESGIIRGTSVLGNKDAVGAEERVTQPDILRIQSVTEAQAPERTGAPREEEQRSLEKQPFHERMEDFQARMQRMSRVLTRLLDAYTPGATEGEMSTTLRRAQMKEDYASVSRPLVFLAKTLETTTQLKNEGASAKTELLESAAESLYNLAGMSVDSFLDHMKGKLEGVARSMKEQRKKIADVVREGREPTKDLSSLVEMVEQMEGVELELRQDMPIVENFQKEFSSCIEEAKTLRDAALRELQQRRQTEEKEMKAAA